VKAHTNKFKKVLEQRAQSWRAKLRKQVHNAMLGVRKYRAPSKEHLAKRK